MRICAARRARLQPRVLVNVSRVDLSAELLGGKSQLPLAVAPTGAVGFGWPGRLWFQAYIFRGREYTFRLMQRARDCGYEALMITVDLPVGGKRERDNRNGRAGRRRCCAPGCR